MSKDIFMFGDCHTHWIRKKIPSLAGLGMGGLNVAYINSIFELKYDKNDSRAKIVQDALKDALEYKDIVVWIGYVDIKQFLPKWKNAELIVKNFVFYMREYFPKANLYFIEPFPQYEETIYVSEQSDPTNVRIPYSYEERRKQEILFINALHKACMENGLEAPITQSEIVKSLGVEKITTHISQIFENKPADHLKTDLYLEIGEMIKSRIS